jgi:hypothetical protein
MKRRGGLIEDVGRRESRALGHRFGGTMTMNSEREVIELEQGWAVMQKAITKLKNLLEGVPEQQFNSEEYIMFYAYFCFSLSLSSSSLGLPFGFVAGFDTREVSISAVLLSLRGCGKKGSGRE